MPDFSITPEQFAENYKPTVSFEEFKEYRHDYEKTSGFPSTIAGLLACLFDTHFLLCMAVERKFGYAIAFNTASMEEVLAFIEKHWNTPPQTEEEG